LGIEAAKAATRRRQKGARSVLALTSFASAEAAQRWYGATVSATRVTKATKNRARFKSQSGSKREREKEAVPSHYSSGRLGDRIGAMMERGGRVAMDLRRGVTDERVTNLGKAWLGQSCVR
jgi:hypothetical protein